MRLKKLILHGFKSFADRTEFAFDSPITGIVGPNGCGKSNVVDGFKWVLGEQSAKSLRGEAMLDVIFNGAAGRKPSNMSEVVLVFDNPKGEDGGRMLNVDADEVSVGRRLFRDGTSEYHLNNHVARLKDVREMFLDTGIGVDAYSVIEQGRVAALLEANPAERRLIFEEAAGISKYKAKKKEAQRKLEKVDQNLLRVQDIVEEVEKRLRSVKVQAGRARTFQEHSVRLRELRLTYALQEYHTLHAQQVELAGRQAAAEARLAEATTALDEKQIELAAQREQYDALGQQKQQGEYELVQTRAAVQAAKQQQQYAQQQIKQASEQLEQLEQDREGVEAKRGEVDETLAAETEQLKELTEEVSAHRRQIEQLQQAFHDGQLQLNQANKDLEQNKSAVLDLMRQGANVNNRLGAIEIERKNISAQQSRLGERRQIVVGELEALDAARVELEAAVAEVVDEITELQGQIEESNAEAAKLGKQIATTSEHLGSAREHRSGLVSRQKLLSDLEAKREGVSEGVKAVLRQRTERFPFIRGLVADLLRVDVEHAPVIEAALDGKDQFLVTDDHAAALAAQGALEDLEGRINVLCTDRLSAALATKAGRAAMGEVVLPGPALALNVAPTTPSTTLETGAAVVPHDAAAVALVPSKLFAAEDVSFCTDAAFGGMANSGMGGPPMFAEGETAAPAAEAVFAIPDATATTLNATLGFNTATPTDGAGAAPLLIPQNLSDTPTNAATPAGAAWSRPAPEQPAPEPAPYDWTQHPQRIRLAIDLVRFEEADATLAGHLLGRTVIVETLADAAELSRTGPAGYRYVTKDCQVIEADGTLRAGPLTAAMGILSRRSELEAIEHQVADVDRRIAHLGQELSSGTAAAKAMQERQNTLRNGLYQANTRKVEVTSKIAQNQDKQSVHRRELPLLERELANLMEQFGRLKNEEGILQEKRQKIEADQAARQHAIEELTVRQGELSDGLRRSGEALTSSRVLLGQVQEKQLGSQQTVRRLEGARGELAQQAERIARSIEQFVGRRKNVEAELLSAQASEAALAKKQEALASEVATLVEQVRAVQQSVEALSAAVEEIGEEHAEVGQTVHQLQLQTGELRVRLEGLVQRTLDELQLDIPARYAELEQGEGYQPTDTDWDAVAGEIKELKEKIQRLGNVNLDAINEMEELEQRQGFLSGQVTDLTTSKAQLEELIETINAESSVRFEQTFNAVREHFQGLFRKLFGGGKADVYLETELHERVKRTGDDGQTLTEVVTRKVDVLEAGIEVIARPPGKQPVSISQLSGGEKTMTCVALLLSIFKSKPSPFCILDEVDAALDEANNQRFNLIVQEFLEQSQFIIITHSKRTMQIADLLYGVTMQEQGVSKRVAVKFDQVDNQGRISETAAA